MPAPSTPEARNLYHEAQALIEQVAVQQAETRRLTSASREVRGTTTARGVQSPRCTRAVRRSAPPTRGAHRPRSGFSTRAGKPRTATPATSSTLGGRATRRHAQRRATTLDRAGATTAGRIAHQHRNHREPACSAGRSARRASPSASASQQRSSSTTGRRTLRVAQRLPSSVSARQGHHRQGYHL
jgi:hypothetical protein